jgi:uncharacterized protein YkwD
MTKRAGLLKEFIMSQPSISEPLPVAPAPRRTERRPRRLLAYGFGAALLLPGGALRACTPTPAPPAASSQADCVAITNNERAAAGLPALSVSGALEQAAAGHSSYQASRNRMTHTGSGGSSAGNRITAAGYRFRTWGENVAAGYPNCSEVMRGWMNSSGHRANILNGAFTQIGVAAATSSNGTIYWTMVLAAPR